MIRNLDDGEIVAVEGPAEPDATTPAARNAKILNLPVEIVVSVGQARLTVRELMDLSPDSIVKLAARIDDPVDLFVGERRVARGELVEVEGEPSAIGVRLIEICSGPDEA